MRCSKGSILIVVLFALVVLSTAALSFAYRVGLESRTVRDRVIRARLQAHADSAFAIALARLAGNTNKWDHPAEPWCSHGTLSAESWLPEWSRVDGEGKPVFATTYRVEDEYGKLHLQYASSEDLETVGLSTEQIDSLCDWQDSDNVMRAEGAEQDYYRSYGIVATAKNDVVEVLDELLMIRGFSRRDYYRNVFEEYASDVSADSEAARLGFVSLLTCLTDGKINPNTAPAEVLNTLPLSDAAVDQIVAFRHYDQYSGGELEEHVFRSAEDIEQLQGLTDMDKSVLSVACRYQSDLFRVFVRSVHVPSGLERRKEWLVHMTDEGAEILLSKGVR